MRIRSPRHVLRRLSAAILLAAAGTACAAGPIVAPLRYEPIVLAPDQPFRASAPDASPVTPTVSLPWRETTLPNGLRVVHLERHGLPIVSVRLVVARGAADVGAPDDTYALLGKLMHAGTQDRTADQLAAAYARLGAVRNVILGPDGCSVSAKVGAEDMDAAIELVAEAATRPRLTLPELRNARAQWLADFENTKHAPRPALQRNASALLFGRAHAYGFARPTTSHTHGLRVEDITALHVRLFHPAQAALIVVGDATAEVVDRSAARWFGAWDAGAPLLPRASEPVPPVAGARVVFVERNNLTQVHAMVLVRGVAPEEDLFAVEVFARMLGGLSSPLREEIRDEGGAAYSFGAGVARMRAAFSVGVGGVFDAGKAIPALRAILAAIRGARASGFGQNSVERARTNLLADWRTHASTNDGLAAMAAAAMAIGQPLDAVAAFPARLQAVTAADVKRVAERYFGEDALRLVVLADGDFQSELTQLGLGAAERRDGYAEVVPP